MRYGLAIRRKGSSIAERFFKELMYLRHANHSASDVVLLDEGIFQQLERAKRARYGVSRAPIGTYADIVRGVKLPNLVVVVTATPRAMSERRSKHRGSSAPAYERQLRATDTVEDDLALVGDNVLIGGFEYCVVENERTGDDELCGAKLASMVADRLRQRAARS